MSCDDASKVLCLLRESDGQRTLLVANLGDAPATPVLGSEAAGATWIDLLDAESGLASVDPAALVLPPMSVRVLGTSASNE